jgi:hypothetical protein
MNDNHLYGLLTTTENDEDGSENFMKSLKFRDNGRKIISVLNEIGEYGVVRGFLCESIIQDEASNSFRSCVLETKGEKVEELSNKLKSLENILVVRELEDSQIEFIIK